MTVCHSGAQADLVLAVILLTRTPEYWNGKHEAPYLAIWWICDGNYSNRIQGCTSVCFVLFLVLILVLGIEPRTSFMLSLDAGGCWFENTKSKYQPKMDTITLVAHALVFHAHCSLPCGLCMLTAPSEEEPSTFQGSTSFHPGTFALCLRSSWHLLSFL